MFGERFESINAGMFAYSNIAVIEKALRGQPLTVAERRAAAHLALRFKNLKDQLLAVQVDVAPLQAR